MKVVWQLLNFFFYISVEGWVLGAAYIILIMSSFSKHLNFKFWNNFRLSKSFKNSTKNSCILLLQLPKMLISLMTTEQLSKLSPSLREFLSFFVLHNLHIFEGYHLVFYRMSLTDTSSCLNSSWLKSGMHFFFNIIPFSMHHIRNYMMLILQR